MNRSPELGEFDAFPVRHWLEGHRDDMLADLSTLVMLETPSGEAALLKRALEWLQGWIDGTIGEPIHHKVFTNDMYGGTVVSEIDGGTDQLVTLLCHYDTVWPKGTASLWPFAVSGDFASGPGVFDMKAGLVQGVWAMRCLKALGLARPRMRLVINPDEEIGSISSRGVIEDACRLSNAVLVLEPSSDGALKTSRKGVGIYEVQAHGVAAHAGLDPEKGACAITGLMRACLKAIDLADPRIGTTVGIGTFNGGTRTNVVASEASAMVDTRARTEAEARRVDMGLRSLSGEEGGVEILVHGGLNRPVMERSAETAHLYELASSVARTMEMDLQEASVGGGSDGNFAAALGLPVLDGLGAIGDKAHAEGEYISVSGMIERATLLCGLLHALSLQGPASSITRAV